MLTPADLDDLPFVRSAELHASLPSTNTRAREVANEALPLPHLVVALDQTAGRGRSGASWWSGEGGLALSLLIDPKAHGVALDDQGKLSLAIGLAVCDTVGAHEGLEPQLKWPNDVLVNHQKVSGVLIESLDNSRMVIGIGLNLNNDPANAPEELRGKVASIAQLVGRKLDAAETLRALLAAIEQRVAQRDELAHDWNAHSVLTGMKVALEDGGRRTEGVCLGITDQGALRLQSDEGVSEHFSGSIVNYRPRKSTGYPTS